MSAKKTAWHPPFTGLLQERGPRWTKVTGEVQVTAEPQRVDDVIEVWADRDHDPSDTGATLHGLWRFILVVALLEYKSIVWPFHRGDLFRLLGYGMTWLSTHQRRDAQPDGSRTERLAAHELTLVLAVPSINAALREELDELDLVLPASDSGYHQITGALVPLVVVDLGVVAEREDDDLVRWFAGGRQRTLEGRIWVRQHQGNQGDTMSTHATPDLFGYDEYMAAFVAELSPEQRLAGLPLGDVILALPDEVLRGLSDDVIETLPADTRQKIRARLGR